MIDLNSNSNAVALQAASRLWNVVSHQGNVGSNSVPTAPFLIERLATAPAPLQVEILDILYQFASATHFSNTESWAHQLRVILNDNVARFTQFFDSTDEDIQSFSELIVESLIEAELKPDR
ncbi:MAG: hypothetical protein K8T91_22415 [Planctomycetes bacterium]|nr:hypothetical protein [Planctomycetota bacterium]